MKLNSNNTMMIGAAILVLAGGYWFFFTGSNTNNVPLTVGTTQSVVETQFQALAGQLSPITFNTDIFSDPRFKSLVDISTPVQPESIGRADPFAPVPGVVGQ